MLALEEQVPVSHEAILFIVSLVALLEFKTNFDLGSRNMTGFTFC